MLMNTQTGFIKTILLIIIALIVLGYFGFDIRGIIESEQVQKNLFYVWSFVVSVWDNYLQKPIMYLWNDIFIELIWGTFVENLNQIKEADDM